MVDKKDEELTDKDLEKATGGTDDRRPIIKRGHTNRPVDPESEDPTPSPDAPRTDRRDQITPV